MVLSDLFDHLNTFPKVVIIPELSTARKNNFEYFAYLHWTMYCSGSKTSYRPSPGLRPKFGTVPDCPGQLGTASNGRTRKFYVKPLEFYVYHPRLLRA